MKLRLKYNNYSPTKYVAVKATKTWNVLQILMYNDAITNIWKHVDFLLLNYYTL